MAKYAHMTDWTHVAKARDVRIHRGQIMEVAQLKDLLGTIATVLFLVTCIISMFVSYIVGFYKTKILNDRLEETIAALKQALVIQRENYAELAKQKTIVVTRDSNGGPLTIQALNTTPEDIARK